MKAIIISILLVTTLLIAKAENKDTLKSSTKEITVSAMRYPEKINEIPMAVSVIHKDELNDLRGFGLEEPFKMIPGVLAQSRAGTTDARITIRGFGARGAGDRSNSGTSRGIKFFLNGIPITEPDGRTSFDLFDMSIANDIEVLRSNASAIWGNAAGGVVSINTIDNVSKPFVNANGIFGSYGLNKYYGTFGVPITDKSSISGSVSSTKYDGFRQNSSAERLLIDLGLKAKFDDKSNFGLFITGTENKFGIPGPLTQAMFDTAYDKANPVYLTRNERRDNKMLQIGTTFEYNIDDKNALNAMAFAAPKYLQRSERGKYKDFTRYHVGGSFSYKNESKVFGSAENKFLAGMDEQYQDGAILFYSLTTDGNRSNNLTDNKKEGANSAGIFIQDELSFEKFSVLFGLRYDNINYTYQDFTGLNFSQQKVFEKATPKFGISYKFSNNNMIYLNFGGGVEVPAGNETDPSPNLGQDTVYLINPMLEPIVSTTYEMGTKNTSFNLFGGFIKSIDYDIAVFMIDVTNDIIPYSGGKFYFTAGKTRRTGLEAGINCNFDFGLSLKGCFTFMSSKYLEYKVDSVHYDPAKSGIFADYKDNKVAGIPEMFYNLGLKYKIEDLNNLYAEVNLEGVGSYFIDDANKTKSPDYSIINCRIGFEKPIKIFNGISAKAYFSINNLLDKKYAGSVFINPDLEKKTNLPIYLESGLPRNFVAGISLIWN